MEDKCANKSFKCDECAHHAQECYTDVAVPKELQTEIVEVIENYIERREKEMEEL